MESSEAGLLPKMGKKMGMIPMSEFISREGSRGILMLLSSEDIAP